MSRGRRSSRPTRSIAEIAGLLPNEVGPYSVVKHRITSDNGTRTDYTASDLRPIHVIPEATEKPGRTFVWLKDITVGEEIGWLTILGTYGFTPASRALVRCRCGETNLPQLGNISRGLVRSCGHVNTHGKH